MSDSAMDEARARGAKRRATFLPNRAGDEARRADRDRERIEALESALRSLGADDGERLCWCRPAERVRHGGAHTPACQRVAELVGTDVPGREMEGRRIRLVRLLPGLPPTCAVPAVGSTGVILRTYFQQCTSYPVRALLDAVPGERAAMHVGLLEDDFELLDDEGVEAAR